jgi:hypothetical protein
MTVPATFAVWASRSTTPSDRLGNLAPVQGDQAELGTSVRVVQVIL